jgi:hypothetical protein
MTPSPPDDAPVPANWDRLRDDDGDTAEELLLPPPESAPPRLTLVAAAWGDLVALVGVLTAALVAVLVAGRPVTAAALPWTCALALTWWVASAYVLLAVRRATPGMLMAGIALRSPPRAHRLVWTLVVALLTAATGGLLALPGARLSPIARVSGAELVMAVLDDEGVG